MNAIKYSFSALGNILRSAEDLNNRLDLQEVNNRLESCQKDFFDDTIGQILAQIRIALTEMQVLENENQLRLLECLAICFIVVSFNKEKVFSNSAASDEASTKVSYPLKKLRIVEKAIFASIKTREVFTELTSHPLFGRRFSEKLNALWAAEQDLAAFYALSQDYLKYIGNVSNIIEDVERTWPEKDTWKILEAFVQGLEPLHTNYCKSQKLDAYWSNYIKLRSSKKNKVVKPKDRASSDGKKIKRLFKNRGRIPMN